MLKEVRKAENNVSLKRKIMYSILIAVLGVAMGLISKFLDTTAFNELPLVLQKMDIVNFFGRFAIWIFICVCISAYSCSPKRAATNTFLFLLAMVTSYYLYSCFVAGFFPKTYALIWFSISVASIFIAYICWYSKGEGFIAVCISAVIFGCIVFPVGFAVSWNTYNSRFGTDDIFCGSMGIKTKAKGLCA